MSPDPVRELIFEVREAVEGGYVGRALGASIFVEADDWAALEREVRDAVACHFEDGARPALARLHFVREKNCSSGSLVDIYGGGTCHIH